MLKPLNKSFDILLFLSVLLIFCVFPNICFFELEGFYRVSDDSLISLRLDGEFITSFPTQDSGLGIGSIVCDKEAIGIWNYKNWTLNIQNLTQSRTKCQINFVSSYAEPILNGADPVIKEGMVPVILEEDGTVIRSSLAWDWYKYEEKRWANAVILEDASISYNYGDVIPEENIESYFVWIPRYQYRLWNMGNYINLMKSDVNPVHAIEIEFGTNTTGNTDTTCVTPMLSGASGACSVGKYMTHPAFISFDTPENTIKGLWVGKFETGYKEAASTWEAKKDINDASKVQIKPNVYSWTTIRVSYAFLTSYFYQREMDSHMMKNTEWGAVAYLSHSKYGIQDSVRINNHSEYKTGYAAVKNKEDTYGTDESITQSWNTEIGVLASTTGNISGVYDMSGGTWEYMMGVMTNESGVGICTGYNDLFHSGFNGTYCGESGNLNDGIVLDVDTKYYDVYAYGTSVVGYNRRILGDATGEMGPFWDDEANVRHAWYLGEYQFVFSGHSWITRGHAFDGKFLAGIFTFGSWYGHATMNDTFRIVLSIL